MRFSQRGGDYSRPSARCSTFSLKSAPPGASWSATQHHDRCGHSAKAELGMSDPANCELIGRWRIAKADIWDRDYLA
jgi:hypothetical protein